MPYITITQAQKLNIPKYSLQSILINKKMSFENDIEWLKQHNYKFDYITETKNYYRFRQLNPILDANFYEKKINENIILLFQSY